MEPLRRYEVTLSSADALAYEMLPRTYSGRKKLALVLPFFAIGAGVGLLPEAWIAGWQFYAIGAVLALGWYGLFTLMVNLRSRRRARRRFPRPVTLTIADHGGHLEVTGDGQPRLYAFELFNAVIRAERHLFLPAGDDVVILPRNVFEPGEFEALADRIDAADVEPWDNRAPAARSA